MCRAVTNRTALRPLHNEMRAAYYEHYGPPETLTIREVSRPVPKAREVLVRVTAASINSWDWDMVRGKPAIVRLWGLSQPRFKIPGADVAGRVEAVGSEVTRFKEGDEVFGDLCESGFSAFAEFVCAQEDTFARKPVNLTFEEAAAVPQAGLMALQSIRDHGKLQPLQQVLINGAGGGVGTFAIQLAKLAGAEITAVDRGSKLAQLRGLGVDQVIDYQQVDFTMNGKRYDLIIDVVSNRPILRHKRSLKPAGTFLLVGGTMSAILQSMTIGPIASRLGAQKLGSMPYRVNHGLDYLSLLLEAGKIKPVIDKVFRLENVAKAYAYYAQGNAVGKIVIKI